MTKAPLIAPILNIPKFKMVVAPDPHQVATRITHTPQERLDRLRVITAQCIITNSLGLGITNGNATISVGEGSLNLEWVKTPRLMYSGVTKDLVDNLSDSLSRYLVKAILADRLSALCDTLHVTWELNTCGLIEVKVDETTFVGT